MVTSTVNGILFNARSLLNKLVELQGILSGASTGFLYDILAITETWLGNEIPDSLVCSSCADYLIFRKDRRCRVGGWCMFLYTQKI